MAVNFTLKVGQVTQRLEVTATAQLVETESGEQSSRAAFQQPPDLFRQARQLEQRGDLVGAEQLILATSGNRLILPRVTPTWASSRLT